VYARNIAYKDVAGWESFSPWLERVETIDAQAVWRIAEEVPPEWYGGDVSEMEQLIEKLLARRGRVRELIVQFRESARRPMPKWGGVVGMAV
jgi:hypothetical protein